MTNEAIQRQFGVIYNTSESMFHRNVFTEIKTKNRRVNKEIEWPKHVAIFMQFYIINK